VLCATDGPPATRTATGAPRRQRRANTWKNLTVDIVDLPLPEHLHAISLADLPLWTNGIFMREYLTAVSAVAMII
jgi:hypothetical protein